ncbi:hypothetical protein BKA70DRAFT_1360347 [Coprinopsis sp. MPI-PUGE-AT-0042]|nr:hypothetical protein BKA70DRAFT_1360347 [Coprinopsis sp. MPI-PUGE-AT-0042]
MPTNGEVFRFRDLSLEYEPAGEEQQAPGDVSAILFIAEGPDQIMPLISCSSNHWVANDDSSGVLSSRGDGLIAFLKDNEFDDIAHVTISQAEMSFWGTLTPKPEGYDPSRRVRMQNELPDVGRWILSWRIEIEGGDEGPLPSPSQQEHELDVEADKVEIQLTDFVVLYKPKENGRDRVPVDISLLSLKVGDQKWSLRLTPSSPNHWEVKESPLITISKETGSLIISLLQGDRLENVAITFVTWKELLGDTEEILHPGDCTGGTELISLTDREGSWRIEWRFERRDPERARDNDLVTRWKRLEALFPGEGWVDRSPDDPASAIAAFHVEDTTSYGFDIISQQGQAMAAKGKGKYGGNLTDIEDAIKVQTLLVVDPRVQQCRQMHAITTSYLGAIYHERFNQTVAIEDLDHALSLYQAAVERSSPEFDTHADCLHRLAEGYHTRYHSTSNDDDSGRAITALSEACNFKLQNSNLLKHRVRILMLWLHEHLDGGESLDPLEKAIPYLLQVLENVQDDPNRPLFPVVKPFGKLISVLVDLVEDKKSESTSKAAQAATLSGDLFCVDADTSQMVEDHCLSSSLSPMSPPLSMPAVEGIPHVNLSSAPLPETPKEAMEAVSFPRVTPNSSVQQLQDVSQTHSSQLRAEVLGAQHLTDERRIAHLEQEVADLRSLLQKSLTTPAAPVTVVDERPRPSPFLSLLIRCLASTIQLFVGLYHKILNTSLSVFHWFISCCVAFVPRLYSEPLYNHSEIYCVHP